MFAGQLRCLIKDGLNIVNFRRNLRRGNRNRLAATGGMVMMMWASMIMMVVM